MARLPTPGGDSGNWGTVLNDYLSQSLNADGTIKSGIITDANVASANKDGASGTASMRTLGTGATQAYPGSTGAANAATIAALEEAADEGLTTQIAQLGGTASATASGGYTGASIGLYSYVTFTPSWLTLGGSSFTLTQPGLYSISLNITVVYNGHLYWSIDPNGSDDIGAQIGAAITSSSGSGTTGTVLIAIYGTGHTNPGLPYSIWGAPASSVVVAQTNSSITMHFAPTFSGGGSNSATYSASIVRLQPLPIS